MGDKKRAASLEDRHGAGFDCPDGPDRKKHKKEKKEKKEQRSAQHQAEERQQAEPQVEVIESATAAGKQKKVQRPEVTAAAQAAPPAGQHAQQGQEHDKHAGVQLAENGADGKRRVKKAKREKKDKEKKGVKKKEKESKEDKRGAGQDDSGQDSGQLTQPTLAQARLGKATADGSAVPTQPQPPAAAPKHPPAVPSTTTGQNIWWLRCRRLITNCIQLDQYEVVAQSLVTWSAAEVLSVVKDWSPTTFAAVFAEWPADKLAALLAHHTPQYIATACESWPEEQLQQVLPLLRTKVVRQVLRALYFESDDPYLTLIDTKHILMAMEEKKRNKVCKKLVRAKVEKVLGADSDEEHDLADSDGDSDSEQGSDSYDDSFVRYCRDKTERTPLPNMGKHSKQKGKGGTLPAGAVSKAHPACWAARVSEAFQAAAKDGSSWSEVLNLLEAMRRAGEAPKLGTAQRWVRMAAVMRCIPGTGGPLAAMPVVHAKKGKGGKGKPSQGPVRRHPPWCPPLSTQQQAWLRDNSSPSPAPATPEEYRGRMTLVEQDGSTQPSKRPPNWSELQIWQPAEDTITFLSNDPKVVRVDVPFVPGAFVLTGLLSPGECQQLIAATEACGYRYDVDYNFNPSNPSSAIADDPVDEHTAQGSAADVNPSQHTAQQPTARPPPHQSVESEATTSAVPAAARAQPPAHTASTTSQEAKADAPYPAQGQQQADDRQAVHPLLSAARTVAGGDRAAGCVWLAVGRLMDTVFRRAAPHLNQKVAGKGLAGINARWRFYRYDAGNVYRPHIDGAWPGSGLKDGKLVHDAYGDRWSHYTFLVYLNDDFEGGSTTFFTPALDDRMALDARGVQPRTGNVLCFPHGDSAASLVHEGSAVLQGAKYVIRTDVLYYT